MRKIQMYYIIDSSEEMIGARIGTVNASLEESYPLLREIEEQLDSDILLRVMNYGTWASWNEDKPTHVDEYVWNDIKAGGTSEFGAALNILGTEIEHVKSSTFIVIIHIAATNPTDDYEAVLKKIESLKSYKNSLRISIRIEDGIDKEIAYKFTGSFGKILSAKDSSMLRHLIISGAEDFFHHIQNDDEIRIEDLGLSIRTVNSLKRAGINTVGDLLRPREEDMMGVRNLGRKSLEEVLEKIKELEIEVKTEEDLVYTEKNHPGRDKCDQLREIRKKIADANGIEFEPAECHHTGPCRGTCPVCDSEIKYLDEQLQKKKERGEEIILTGIAEADIKKSHVNIPEEEEFITMGAPVIDGGIESFDLGGLDIEDIDEGNDEMGSWGNWE